MSDPIYVSFATPVYEQELHGLRDSLDRFGLEHDLTVLPSLGSWELNANMKPFFIGMMLMKHQRPVVWLDADARVEKMPDWSFVPPEYDKAIAKANWWQKGEVLSGTIYLRGPSKSVTEFLGRWTQRCIEYPNMWDQRNLAYWVGDASVLEYWPIPPEYCAFDRRVDAGEVKREDVVIWHRQKSRELRRKVDAPS